MKFRGYTTRHAALYEELDALELFETWVVKIERVTHRNARNIAWQFYPKTGKKLRALVVSENEILFVRVL